MAVKAVKATKRKRKEGLKVAKVVPDCKNCKSFKGATDPNISLVYMGACKKIEYPYEINIPKVDGIEGECDYFE